MTDLFFSVKKRVFVHFRTETLRTKLEPVHFRSGIESRVFLVGKKKLIIMKMRVGGAHQCVE